MRNKNNSFTEDVCHGKRRGYLTPSFCWDSEGVNPLPSFYSPGMVESRDIRLVLCTRDSMGCERSVLTGHVPETWFGDNNAYCLGLSFLGKEWLINFLSPS